MGLVGGNEAERVAGLGLHEIGFEHHRTLFALVQHLNLVLRGRGRTGCQHDCKGCGDGSCVFHDRAFLTYFTSLRLRPLERSYGSTRAAALLKRKWEPERIKKEGR